MANLTYDSQCLICATGIEDGSEILVLRTATASRGSKVWRRAPLASEGAVSPDHRGGRKHKDLEGVVHADCMRNLLFSAKEG